MKILSMTATFGKLEHQALTFDPNMQVMEAPNEWGKSTWCAFIAAMLYGFPSRKRTTDTSVEDKDRYAPWSGAPMAGRMEIEADGKYITLERQSKGRVPFNQFRAYDTQSGAPIEELTADNCGQMLLGIEKDVFLRSAFIRQAELPVSDSQALRARLNALVTTGDESGAAQALAEKLNGLKNKCRHNKTGLLPEAERQRLELFQKLEELRALQSQSAQLKAKLQELEGFEEQLKNHQAALNYAANITYAQKLSAAQNAEAMAQEKVADLQAHCADIPDEQTIAKQLLSLQQLRMQREELQLQSQLLPPAPIAPAEAGGSREAVAQARADYEAYARLTAKASAFPLILGIGLLAAAGGLLLLPMPWLLTALLPLAAGVALLIGHFTGKEKQAAQVRSLMEKYPGIAPESWEAAAGSKLATKQAYEQACREHQEKAQALQSRMSALQEQTQALTAGISPIEFEQQLISHRQKHSALADARRELNRAQELLSALKSTHREATPPTRPDALTYSAQETAQLLADTAAQRSALQRTLGQCQGRMETLGQEEALQKQLTATDARIAKLEQTLGALELAREYLEQATRQLQQRFAPRISQRAQAIMARLTGGRYDRLYLESDFAISTGAREEITLHDALSRSDGTLDQLYFALRLAVAQELAPKAPLILDDAFVRFDDERTRQALKLLKEESKDRQVLIFTCQSRESRLQARQRGLEPK